MSSLDPIAQSSLPGLSAEVQTPTVSFLKHIDHVLENGIRIQKDTVDNSETLKTKLVAGEVLVRVEAGGNINKFVHNADTVAESGTAHADAPATADIKEAVILSQFVQMLGPDGVAVDRHASGVIHGIVDENKIDFGTADTARIAKIKAVMPLVKFEKLVV